MEGMQALMFQKLTQHCVRARLARLCTHFIMQEQDNTHRFLSFYRLLIQCNSRQLCNNICQFEPLEKYKVLKMYWLVVNVFKTQSTPELGHMYMERSKIVLSVLTFDSANTSLVWLFFISTVRCSQSRP